MKISQSIERSRAPLAVLWTLVGLMVLAQTAEAQRASRRTRRAGAPKRNAAHVARMVRQRSDEILQVQALAGRDAAQPFDDEDDVFRVESKPPTRERLFKLRSTVDAFKSYEAEFRERDPDQTFLFPTSYDDFDDADSATLSSMWFGNRETGKKGSREDLGHKGEMGIKGKAGIYPTGSPTEVAILNQSIDSTDMEAWVDIDLGGPNGRFGIVFRALEPLEFDNDSDHAKVNSFQYVVAGADSVTAGESISGKRRVLKTARIAPRTKFRLTVRAFGDEVVVLRDDDEILRAKAMPIEEGEFAGLIGLASDTPPVTFDNFRAKRYGGVFAPRAYAQSASIFEGPNVHYNPLYFEQVALERYGQHLGNWFQPWIAHGLFFVDVLACPYSIGKSPPWAVHSGEGYFKPGDPVLPFKLLPPPTDKGGYVTQAVAMALTFAIIP